MELQLRAGIQQAMRDRNVRVNEFIPVDFFQVIAATTFLDEEIAANTAGIITTFYSDVLLPSLALANDAGIPIYIVGGADPELYQGFQKREPATGPIHASIRYIGPDMAQVATSLASRLISLGITHLECIASDVAEVTWYRQCGRLVDVFQESGLSGRRQLRAPVVFDLTQYVAEMAGEFALVPAREIAIVVPNSVVYKGVRVGLADSHKAGVKVVVYETSVDILEDVRAGRNVLALDFNYYTQGFLGLALASAERQTGQMVTSDIITECSVYGQGAREVTDATMQREVCRTEGYPVCGDPGVAPVTPTGCPCFNRSEVVYKVLGVTPSRVPYSANLWQGMADAERDLPGSTFRWNIQPEADYDTLIAEIAEVTNSTSQWHGAISLDTMFLDIPRVSSALRALTNTGKPLYLGLMQAQGPPNATAGVLASVGARTFVGANCWAGGYLIARYAVQLGYEHALGVNVVPFFPWAWKILEGMVAGVVGTSYQYPDGTWDWPLTMHGNASQRTGAWSLFVAPGSNHTAQLFNGVSPLDYLPAVTERLSTDIPPPDMVVSISLGPFSLQEVLPVLQELQKTQPSRPPVGLIMHQCTKQEFQAFARLGHHTGERVVGHVCTERLIRATHLPPSFQTRVACETQAYSEATSRQIFGKLYPVCDAHDGCVDPSSGSGTNNSLYG
eukprot:jgi/Mesvir1/21932/Mv16715-RA.1